ncbi:3-phosphoshikimate 1-carboxyvinyltransferase [Candidatus Endowatersipora endosymbiont of Watersipora subatra]|uniref:3-phosphoshikimate 1-carboxyvinyltransferase n=1 Tax=Candidatus Endowatersipora endosymbiont of Watersipora subatra TaxID=3077946 RepID=UPI00312CA3F4
MLPIVSDPVSSLSGQVKIPGDQSISHLSLILGAIADGQTCISGLLEADDIIATTHAMRALGANIHKEGDHWLINGIGNGSLLSPHKSLNFGNSETGSKLTIGLVSSYDFPVTFIGDSSFSIGTILDPLLLTGLQVDSKKGDRLPIRIQGAPLPMPIIYKLSVASFHIKSAILLAGLNIAGITTVIEPVSNRDCTEKMLARFGANISIHVEKKERRYISITGHKDLIAQDIIIPSDFLSASFVIVAGLIVPSSDIIIRNLLVPPTRKAGLFKTLIEMGAGIDILEQNSFSHDTIITIRVRHSQLSAIDVPSERTPLLTNEYPLLAVAASFAKGETRIRGIKGNECDRLSVTVEGLKANGVVCEEGKDGLIIVGGNGKVKGGGIVGTDCDHRIAMSFLVMGMASHFPIGVNDINTKNPFFCTFLYLMKSLGAKLTIKKGIGGFNP